jgi:hypothetical protein
MCHRTVFGAPGASDSKLFTFGFLRPRSAIIHWTVWCASGATAGQRNGQLQRSLAKVNSLQTVRAESKQRQKAHRTVNSTCPVHHWTVSSAPGASDSKLFTFGFLRPRSAIIHRNVRCASGATAGKRNGQLQQSPTNVNSARTVRVELEQRQKAHWTMNSTCPVHQEVRAPAVETVRTLTVG